MFTIADRDLDSSNDSYFMVMVFEKISISYYCMSMATRIRNDLSSNSSKTVVMAIIAKGFDLNRRPFQVLSIKRYCNLSHTYQSMDKILQ